MKLRLFIRLLFQQQVCQVWFHDFLILIIRIFNGCDSPWSIYSKASSPKDTKDVKRFHFGLSDLYRILVSSLVISSSQWYDGFLSVYDNHYIYVGAFIVEW